MSEFNSCYFHQVPGVTDKGLKARPIKTVAVIGGGLMGSGIVTSLVTAGIRVVLKEVNQEYLQQGLERVKGEVRLHCVFLGPFFRVCGFPQIPANFASRIRKGTLSEERVQKMIGLITPTISYDEFKTVDLVIEVNFW